MSVLQWSSPVRKRGAKILSPLPNEIYLEIFHLIRSTSPTNWMHPSVKRNLSNVALVCRFFGSVTLPWIFETLVFKGKTEKNASSYQNHASFCRSILKRQGTAHTMAQHVKKCAFSSWILQEDHDMQLEWCFQEFLSLYLRSMREMSNIQELSLMSTPITKDSLKAMTSLQQLETLVLKNCVLADDVADKHLRKFSSLELKSLSVICTTGLDDDDDPFNRLLDHISFNTLVNLSTTSPYLVRKLAKRQENFLLEKLDLFKIDDIALLGRIFSKTPALRSFRNTFLALSAGTSFKLDPKALPHLETVEAPLSLLEILIPTRPVSSITISALKDAPVVELPMALILKSSSRPIVEMRIPANFYINVPFWKHFPDLRTLEICILIKFWSNGPPAEQLVQKAISDLVRAWPKQPQLRTLILDIDCCLRLSLDLVMQHTWILEDVWPRFPTLRECRFDDYLQWFYYEAESKWKPAILPAFYFVVEDLKNGRMRYTDYEGCIEHLLSETVSS